VTRLDDKLVPKAYELIEKFGKVVSFISGPPASGYDPTTGKNATFTADTYSVKVTPPQEYEQKYIDGDLIQVGDVQIFLAAQNLTFTPKNGMDVTIDSENWKIVSFGKIYTGEQVALYEFQLRK
jgi:hypothetical protein